MTFWHMYVVGTAAFLIGAFGLRKAPPLSGLMTLSKCAYAGGMGLLLVTFGHHVLR